MPKAAFYRCILYWLLYIAWRPVFHNGNSLQSLSWQQLRRRMTYWTYSAVKCKDQLHPLLRQFAQCSFIMFSIVYLSSECTAVHWPSRPSSVREICQFCCLYKAFYGTNHGVVCFVGRRCGKSFCQHYNEILYK